jgi:hypothetical protein
MSTPPRPIAADEAEAETLDGPSDPSGGSPYRISRAAVVLIAIALGLGLLLGRASVKTDSSGAGTSPTPVATRSSSVVALGPHSLAVTGAMCSMQVGDDLVLGVEARNISSTPLILKKLRVSLPLGGLTIVSRGVGSCGELDVPKLEDFGLAPQGAVWFTTTVRPTETCPAPYPVLLSVDVTDPTGKNQLIGIGGFKDLGSVPWAGCTSASPSS